MVRTRSLVISRHMEHHIRITNEGPPYLVDNFRTWWLNLIPRGSVAAPLDHAIWAFSESCFLSIILQPVINKTYQTIIGFSFVAYH